MDAPASRDAQRVVARSSKEKAQDELVMQTNSSSIVSKRSVERIYYPDEPHYFRYFVKKFQRRAPLINRGYHLRLHVIDTAVRRFLERPSENKTKVVVNLGCGSDVLPWQCMTRYPDACHRTKFIDIDFPDLMMKKRTIVLNTPELSSVFEPLDTNAGEHVLLNSDMYSQIGCDLRNTADVEKALSKCLNLSECTFMFVAEVSITYMEVLMESSNGPVRSVKILPDGPDHPFAKTMLSHFEKLNTPLKSVFEYPHLEAQHQRFSRLGWMQVDAVSLWQTWTNDNWIPASKRRELDVIEPFDEWEEFALFASHYCVVIARNFSLDAGSTDSDAGPKHRPLTLTPELHFHAYSKTQGKRRFGATLQARDESGEEIFVNTFGLGTNTRLKSLDLYSFEPLSIGIRTGHVGPGNRVCHAIADLGSFGSLLVGGRTSPTTALRDCWHFSTEKGEWSPTDNLPVPLFRHAVTQLGRSNMTILIGGRSNSSTVFAGCLVHRPGHGWTECNISGSVYRPVFGAMLVSFRNHYHIDDSDLTSIRFDGVLMGGLLEDGTVARQLLRWCLELPANGNPTISFYPIESYEDTALSICRFGASALLLEDAHIIIVGGIQHDGIVPRVDEVLAISPSHPNTRIISRCSMAISDKLSSVPRPLLVGASVSLLSHQLLVMGGGATCFSMGTYWNEGCYTLDLSTLLGKDPLTSRRGTLKFQKSVEVTDRAQPPKSTSEGDSKLERAKILDIPKIRVSTEDEFEKILKAGKPVIIEGIDLGTCAQKWTKAYLTENVVHEASSSKMDFNSKNFSYITTDFASFMGEVEKGGKQYLRALSEEHPSDHPANIEVDFPGIASDFQLPPELSFVKKNEHSSVLRISGRVNMWLHYDVMANVYCQISGSKKLLLFPPEDVSHLSFAPGASSSSIDVFSGLETPSLASTHPHEATLGPGDVLFLPPLWLHATAPLTDLGVAVNVFFRNLEAGYASGRDVYGNRDIAAYEKGRHDVERIANSFSKLPRDVQAFYMRRLVDEMAQHIPR
ncbi:hypothetical protein FHL15_006208 [Xylaria flabelliformis]|uniref:tRNA wybutosine-synthesizing protein 4 n=1 Tax=Xylaria flabelliformis TaxID=2512241 RepID=A0A553HXZ0_9PEZI|nr:hypothetical protein FHL15_006208 [Xylaria flabelliformis]